MSQPFLPLINLYNNGERNFQKFYLQNAELAGLSLAEIDLSEADLRGANLEEADLSRAVLRGALLAGANLRRATLVTADLSDADLSYANLEGANLTGGDLSRANLKLADFTRADLTRSRLVEVNGQGQTERIDAQNVVIQRTNFTEAILREANLSDARLRWCNLQAADLSQAKLLRADLSDADGSPIKLLHAPNKITRFQHADLTLVSFRKSQIVGDFQKATLTHADLREASLTGSFREANLTGILMQGTILTGSDFTGGILSGVNLEGARLTKCIMPNGKPPGWDTEKFVGDPPSLSAKGVIRKKPVYVEFWFKDFEQILKLLWPKMCPCCCRNYDRSERLELEAEINGTHHYYELSVPFCTACLQHHIRSQHVENWMKTVCTAPGGSFPAVKFEVKSRGIVTVRQSLVISFASMEYVLAFAAANNLKVQGAKNHV